MAKLNKHGLAYYHQKAIEPLKRLIESIPTKTSDLDNDSGFITSSAIPTVPTKTSELNNDSGFITSSSIPFVPTKTSQLQNDSNFLTTIPNATTSVKGGVIVGDGLSVTNGTISTNKELLGFSVLTQAQYDALSKKDANTIYLVTE